MYKMPYKNSRKAMKINKGNQTIKQVKICLCMIVKNESKIIHRCLDSAKGIIDFISILDTGNPEKDDWDNGNTQKIINDWGEHNSIPTKIHNEPFVNFSVSRSRSAELATKTWPEADYLLMIDADMVMDIKDGFDKNKLVDGGYYIKQYSSSSEYFNLRLARVRTNDEKRLQIIWKALGVTHEYWNGSINGESVKTTRLKTLMIDDREDGGCKSDKFVRDEKLLVDGLNDPNESPDLKVRYKFYLGQTLKCLGKYEESNEMYNERIKSGGWFEEIFYSHYQIALNYNSLHSKSKKMLSSLEKALDGVTNKDVISLIEQQIQNVKKNIKFYRALMGEKYLEAWNNDMERIDPLYDYIKVLREEGKNKLALFYALEAKKHKFPEDRSLFINRRIWDYLIDYEIVICAYYVQNQRNEGVKAIKRLRTFIMNNSIPNDLISSFNKNVKFYGL